LSNEEKTNDNENFEKGMIYMKILKKGGSREKGEEETKSMPKPLIEVCLKSAHKQICEKWLSNSQTLLNYSAFQYIDIERT
jgi:hypothetical protein